MKRANSLIPVSEPLLAESSSMLSWFPLFYAKILLFLSVCTGNASKESSNRLFLQAYFECQQTIQKVKCAIFNLSASLYINICTQHITWANSWAWGQFNSYLQKATENGQLWYAFSCHTFNFSRKRILVSLLILSSFESSAFGKCYASSLNGGLMFRA